MDKMQVQESDFEHPNTQKKISITLNNIKADSVMENATKDDQRRITANREEKAYNIQHSTKYTKESNN